MDIGEVGLLIYGQTLIREFKNHQSEIRDNIALELKGEKCIKLGSFSWILVVYLTPSTMKMIFTVDEWQLMRI
jgi:hypothetical protein